MADTAFEVRVPSALLQFGIDQKEIQRRLNEWLVLSLFMAETIVLAHELQADWVLMDERKGRRKLTQLGLNKIGTVGILLQAKQPW